MKDAIHDALTRMFLAAVWLHQGLWLKLLGRSARQTAIVAAVAGSNASLALRGIGLAECGMAAWVLSGRRLRSAAIAQTALLTAMNVAGTVWARRLIDDPAGMLLQSAAFLALAWTAAERRDRHAV
jgi:hypothetical protein